MHRQDTNSFGLRKLKLCRRAIVSTEGRNGRGAADRFGCESDAIGSTTVLPT
jgi:hypothetical protein